ncbi:hypothetical protein ACFL0R_04580, partial [Pseudomonadota bacterium]
SSSPSLEIRCCIDRLKPHDTPAVLGSAHRGFHFSALQSIYQTQGSLQLSERALVYPQQQTNIKRTHRDGNDTTANTGCNRHDRIDIRPIILHGWATS